MNALNTLQHTLSPTRGILLSLPSDITYYTGFRFLVPEEREGFLVVTAQKSFLIKASFTPFEAAESADALTVLQNCSPPSLAQHLHTIVTEQHLTELVLDGFSLYYQEYQALASKLAETKCTLLDLDRTQIWKQRMIKSVAEIQKIRAASTILTQAMAAILSHIHPGLSEKAIALELESEFRRLGAEGPAFPTIVAFGPHGAEPHYQPSADTSLVANTPILIDAGAAHDGYRSDITRTIWFGDQPSAKFTATEKIVKAAYQAVIAELSKRSHRPAAEPLRARDLDHAARSSITAAGQGKFFIHTTGHGVGLDIHEPPSLNWQNEMVIEKNMIVTDEPGLYYPGEFGYRFENTLLVTTSGSESLTSNSR